MFASDFVIGNMQKGNEKYENAKKFDLRQGKHKNFGFGKRKAQKKLISGEFD